MENQQNLSSFGSHTMQQVTDLQKALSLDGAYATSLPGSLKGGNALAVEDLDRTLKVITFRLKHLKLWNRIAKQNQPQVVTEYNILNSYGITTSPFFAQGGVPTQTDSQYARDTATVKYLGTHGQVNHNLTVIQAAHGSVIANEVKNKTIELLAKNEFAMFQASDAINGLEYNGIDATLRKNGKYSKNIFPKNSKTMSLTSM